MIAPLQIEPRWTDLDPAGHVNNSVFLVYAEEARNRLLHRIIPTAWSHIVVVHNGIDYHHPVLLDDRVEVTSAVEKIGTSSFTTVSVISTATQRCATVRTVQVVLDEERSGSRPWTAEERAALHEELVA
ncbi:thioesterase family protein [Mycolicibacterium sp.]|uniref:acyl-CoA thioesterase n=1 Tax=Mycolicibacterium sp. TaxID=2320850 RepID=UPI001A3624E4|nr:thioesterase family protein [Mycolicibacterium sp.]MBJ7336374.1 acyl-CoA thioesterase [Mycolicibacterium sp.]